MLEVVSQKPEICGHFWNVHRWNLIEMHPEVVWDSKHLRDCWFCGIWVCTSIFMRWTWHSSFFFLQQKSLRAHSRFSEAFFCGTRKDHAKRSLANRGRPSLVNHAKLSLRNPPGRCESQSEIDHPPSMLWWLCKQQEVSTDYTDVPNPWETSRLFQFEGTVLGVCWISPTLDTSHTTSKSYWILVLLRFLLPAHNLLVWVSAWRMEGCVTPSSNQPEVPVAVVPPVHQSRWNFESSGDFHHTVDGKRHQKKLLSCTML